MIMNPQSVLIVEDTEVTRIWLAEMVGQAWPSARIVSVIDVRSAKLAIKDQHFDLCLIDLGLPDGSGIEIIETLKLKPDPGYIVVATIYDDDRNVFDALRAGANGYILKDDPKPLILEYLRGLDQNKHAFSERALGRVVNHFHEQGEVRAESSLTVREEEVLVMLAKGYSAAETATSLGLTNNTVKGYIKNVYSKIGASSRAQATTWAIKQNLIEI
jgi:DNA-binding NarL/FixJ family response regulator